MKRTPEPPADLRVRVRDLLATFEPDGRLLVRSSSRGVGALVPPFAAAVLSFCSMPRTRADLVESFGEPAAHLFDQLSKLQLLLPPDEAEDTPVMFGNFAGVEIHRSMLADELRIGAYRRALEAVIKPGDVVIDAGAGTGVLSVLAAKAGAGQVYAIERNEFARVARQVADDSGVGDRVEVMQTDFRKVELPRKARVLVTETFGSWALAEGAAADLLLCAERNLEPDGVLIPGSISLWLAPMAKAPATLLEPFRLREDGVDLRGLAEEARGRSANMEVTAGEIGKAALVGTFPLLHDLAEEPIKAEVTLEGPCEALCAWFTLHLAPGIDLPTGPADPPTHWRQTVLPVSLPAGRRVLRMTIEPAPEDRRAMEVTFSGAARHTVRVR